MQRHDHQEIAGGDVIIRRVSEKQVVVDKNGRRRIASILYKSSAESSLSTDIEKLIVEAGLDPKTHVTTPRWVGSVSFSAAQLREIGLLVGFDPIDENPFHGAVWGANTRQIAEKIADIAQWYVEIPGVATA